MDKIEALSFTTLRSQLSDLFGPFNLLYFEGAKGVVVWAAPCAAVVVRLTSTLRNFIQGQDGDLVDILALSS